MRIKTAIYAFVLAALFSAYTSNAESPAERASDSRNGFLVIAPDRGFMGNEQTRNAFNQIDQVNKQLVFITDELSREYLDEAITALTGTKRRSEISVMPLFLSVQHPGWQLSESWLVNEICDEKRRCNFSDAFGQSYFAVDVLDEVLAQVDEPQDKRLILIGEGADNAEQAAAMAEDWMQIANFSSKGPRFKSLEAFIWSRDGDSDEQGGALKKLAADDDAVLVSLNFGWWLDSMMSFDAMLQNWLLRDVADRLLIAELDDNVTGTWLQRETSRGLIDSADDIGVIVHAHGSDFHWNQTMRDAVEPLHEKYAVEFAFSMADRPSIEVALARLQRRGLKGAVIVRVFGREDSFQASIEKMVGMDIESGHENVHRHQGGGQGHMMDSGRIRTPLVVTSVGGLGDNPLFAEAMLARAQELSVDARKETVILVAHGSGDDDVNERWIGLLENVAKQVNVLSEGTFRAIHVATWREDWPDKREEWVARVRGMVTAAQSDGGRALVIPARTNAQGPEAEFLEGLTFALGEGFAPHPLFAVWVESQANEGVRSLLGESTELLAREN